jgi:alpha-galactosidase/6-phospho-beta-glucosidase family protein
MIFNQIKIVSLGVGGGGVGFRLCLFRFVSSLPITPQAEVTLIDFKSFALLASKII